MKLQIKSKYEKRYKQRNPLILKDSIVNHKSLKEGDQITLVDHNNRYIGSGYYGLQNKGIGWILTFNQRTQINENFFAGRIDESFQKRRKQFNHENTNAYRVFNGEGDGIGGLTIDYFDGYFLIQFYSEGIYAYREWIYQAIQRLEGYIGIYEKRRFNSKGKYIEGDDFVCGDHASQPLIVRENKVNFAIYLNDGAMVGVFLDQREVRKCLRDKYSKGKEVLNTFSYTGAFSIFAALGGATKTTSVDLANRSLSKTREHFEINQIDYSEQSIIVEDVFKFFKYANRKELEYDVVVLDPPSFAKSKKHIFSAAKDYTGLLMDTINITKNNGIIVASTNCAGFDMKRFKQFVKTAFESCGARYEIVEAFRLPEDFATIKEFPEGNYLKVLFLRVSK